MLKAKVIRAPVPTRLEDELNAFFHRKGLGQDKLVDLQITALDRNTDEGSRQAREYVAVLLYRE